MQTKVTIPPNLLRYHKKTRKQTITSELSTNDCLMRCLEHTDFKCRSFTASTASAFECVIMNDTLATVGAYDNPAHNEELNLYTRIDDCEYEELCHYPMLMKSLHVQ